MKDLSWDGHEFLAVMSNDTVFKQLKSALNAKDIAGLPLRMVYEVGLDLTKQWLKGKLGILE